VNLLYIGYIPLTSKRPFPIWKIKARLIKISNKYGTFIFKKFLIRIGVKEIIIIIKVKKLHK
jgi:hypothetical protein